MWSSRDQKPAPSTSAASLTSRGIEVSPARMMTVAKGSRRQTWTAITDAIARLRSPNHMGHVSLPMMCRAWSTQFTGL